MRFNLPPLICFLAVPALSVNPVSHTEHINGDYTFGPETLDPDSLYQYTLEFEGCGTVIVKSTGMTIFDKLSVRSDDPDGFKNSIQDSPRPQNIIEGFVREPSVHISAQTDTTNLNMTLYIRFLKQDCPESGPPRPVTKTIKVDDEYTYGPETMPPNSLYQWTLEFSGCGKITAKSTEMTRFDTLSVRSDAPNGYHDSVHDTLRIDNTISFAVKEPSVYISAQSNPRNPNMTFYVNFVKSDCTKDNGNTDNGNNGNNGNPGNGGGAINVVDHTVEVTRGYYVFGPETMDPNSLYQIKLQFTGSGNITVTGTGMMMADSISVRSDDANGFRQEVKNAPNSENTIQGQVNGPSVYISAQSNPTNQKMTLHIKFNGSMGNGFLLAVLVMLCRLLG